MERRKFTRANALPVSVRCPVCSEMRTIEFDADDLEDPAFAECYQSQPWNIPCDECELLIWDEVGTQKEFFAIHDACICGEPWAIRYVRELIQKS